ncbi:hypothetical protein GHT06_009183 [Daphnia sinensis]|uniref:Uncharacterized protein n=1 Tax=Daphnia sinensis TaxID=1820382 RepID=A0AAD5LMF0_9CRUS|nr:hypothetical protein GHT06_009183 [Daphnia sinensis]
MANQDSEYRVVVFGAGRVGKSSLVLRFLKDTFCESYVPTVEDFYCQNVEFVSYTLDGQLILCNKNSVCNLQIVDTAGSYSFPAMQRLNIAKGRAFIMVYSVTSRQTLEQLESTWQTIREIKGSLDNVPLMLVGNKCDEMEARELTVEEGKEQARHWSSSFIETSAKANYNVKKLFRMLLACLLAMVIANQGTPALGHSANIEVPPDQNVEDWYYRTYYGHYYNPYGYYGHGYWRGRRSVEEKKPGASINVKAGRADQDVNQYFNGGYYGHHNPFGLYGRRHGRHATKDQSTEASYYPGWGYNRGNSGSYPFRSSYYYGHYPASFSYAYSH